MTTRSGVTGEIDGLPLRTPCHRLTVRRRPGGSGPISGETLREPSDGHRTWDNPARVEGNIPDVEKEEELLR